MRSEEEVGSSFISSRRPYNAIDLHQDGLRYRCPCRKHRHLNASAPLLQLQIAAIILTLGYHIDILSVS